MGERELIRAAREMVLGLVTALWKTGPCVALSLQPVVLAVGRLSALTACDGSPLRGRKGHGGGLVDKPVSKGLWRRYLVVHHRSSDVLPC
jgi:hypothetical protein